MRSIKIAAIAAASLISSSAIAQVALKGNYISTAVGTAGTLGTGGSTSPGLIHDPSGTGSFDPANDYITPGTPHQGFAITSNESGFRGNDNNGGGSFGSNVPTILVGAAAKGYASAVSWTGSNAFLSITNSYFLNPGDQRIVVSTTLTALQNLTGLAFVTGVDPDPDVGKFGSYSTNNQRGNSIYGVDDFVGSAGSESGLTLGILNLDANGFVHSTQINSSCCSTPNPFDVLNHSGGDIGLSGLGDYGLALAYNIGTLGAGTSASFDYAYAVGEALDTTGGSGPITSAAPEPSTWAFMIFGFGMAGGSIRRRQRVTRTAVSG
jgi:hypothetical protein